MLRFFALFVFCLSMGLGCSSQSVMDKEERKRAVELVERMPDQILIEMLQFPPAETALLKDKMRAKAEKDGKDPRIVEEYWNLLRLEAMKRGLQ